MIKKYCFIIFSILLGSKNLALASQENWQQQTRETFQQIDINSDGKISTTEYFIVESVRLGYRTHLTNMWKFLDLNNDGTVTTDEYLGIQKSQEKVALANNEGKIEKYTYWFIEELDYPQYKKHLNLFFDFMDEDKDGFITTDEYKNTFIAWDGKKLTQEGEKYAQAIDTNNDEKISKKEFLKFDFKMPNKAFFKLIDTNHDTYISEDEMVIFMDKAIKQLW